VVSELKFQSGAVISVALLGPSGCGKPPPARDCRLSNPLPGEKSAWMAKSVQHPPSASPGQPALAGVSGLPPVPHLTVQDNSRLASASTERSCKKWRACWNEFQLSNSAKRLPTRAVGGQGSGALPAEHFAPDPSCCYWLNPLQPRGNCRRRCCPVSPG